MKERLAITICATKDYCFAMRTQARAVQANVSLLAERPELHLIIATDQNPGPIDGIVELYKELFIDIQTHILRLPVNPSRQKDYENQNQVAIAQLRTAAFSKARFLNADLVWSLDSDVLPDTNNLRAMRDMLSFDGGFYSVAFVPYVSAGGGGYMGGGGTYNNHILPCVYENERAFSDEFQAKLNAHRDKVKDLKPGEQIPKEWHEENGRLHKEMETFPAKDGNIFARNAKGWRKRGWLNDAFPEVGKGGILPSDWMPFGNNLFAKRVLPYLDFTGYEGKGTEDLACGWLHIVPNGFRLCVLPHCLSHHVRPKKEGNTLLFMFHEQSGEMAGHLRFREIPWFSNEAGE